MQNSTPRAPGLAFSGRVINSLLRDRKTTDTTHATPHCPPGGVSQRHGSLGSSTDVCRGITHEKAL